MSAAMKLTLSVTQHCNLRCSYCYIGKNPAVMPLWTAARAVDFFFRLAPPGEELNIGFFGGEPLLEFRRIKEIVKIVKGHPSYSADHVTLSLVTNGTIWSDPIAAFIHEHDVNLCISSDGAPDVQDAARHYASGGRATSPAVARNIRAALTVAPSLLVNSVYGPATLARLPESVAYHLDLGVRRVFLSPDYSASWPPSVEAALRDAYGRLSAQYVQGYMDGRPFFVNLIDNKIAAMLRGGFDPSEKCRMGTHELAVAPSGNLYPCERLIGSDDGGEHCVGSVETGLDLSRMACRKAPGGEANGACVACGVKEYCTNWCGCSNSFATGYYNRVSPFQCASERAAIQAAFDAFRQVEARCGHVFVEHLSGTPFVNAMNAPRRPGAGSVLVQIIH